MEYKITFARNADYIRRAWVERAEILPPTVTVTVPVTAFPPEVRGAYTGEEISLVAGHSVEGRLRFASPKVVNGHLDGVYVSEVAPTVDEAPSTTEEVVALVTDWHRRSTELKRRFEEQNRRWREEYEERRRRDEEAQRRAEEARARKRAEYEAERTRWIQEHGSPRLKRLLEEGIGLDRTYRAERLALERPGFSWLSEVCGKPVGIRDASEAALAALDEARRVAPDAKLVWLADGNHVCDDDGNGYPTCDFEPGPAILAVFLDEEVIKRI